MSILTMIREILMIASIVTGAVIAFPFVKKKILEDKLKTTIDELDSVNKNNAPFVYKLLEKYSFKEVGNYPISIKEISNIYNDILLLKRKLFLAQGEVATLAVNIEEFIRRVIHWYKHYSFIILTCSEIYSIVNNVLYDMYYFMTKNIPFPNNSLLRKDPYINKKMFVYCSNTSINIYQHFEIGRIHNVSSAIYPLFYNHINKIGNSIFYKSLVEIYGMNIQYFIIRLLYLHKYYLPILLEYKDEYGFPNQYLVLVGFRLYRSLGNRKKQ